jgi:hypothetical protein
LLFSAFVDAVRSAKKKRQRVFGNAVPHAGRLGLRRWRLLLFLLRQLAHHLPAKERTGRRQT